MADAARARPVLARMARRTGADTAPEADLERLLGLAVMRTGQDVLDLRLSVTAAETDAAAGEAVAGALPDPGLHFRLDRPEAPGEAPAGVLSLCPQLLAALIEVQTTGAVLTRAAEARVPTATDAAMAEAFAEGLLARFAVLSSTLPDPPPLAGLALQSRFADPGAAALAMPAGGHSRWRLTLDLAGGAKTGLLHLAVAPPETLDARDPDPVWRVSFERAVMASPALLEAVLTRLKLPLADIGGFEAGQVIPLGGAALDDVCLAAPGGGTVARARLGRAGDRRAVRIAAIESLGHPAAEALAKPEADTPRALMPQADAPPG